ncbi:MAG: GNAT family N-acetyltransferase [Candidatus Eremiobacteraeota bacterium]|nr:GNAT family N-acetyltransferase [Candidatus Eremiobacteraeota bacterium]
MSEIRIRPGTSGDREFVEHLGKRTLVDSVAAWRHSSPPMLDIAFERLLTFVYDQPHHFLIAELDGKRAGFVLTIHSLPDEVTLAPQAFIAYMSVEPDMRRAGVAAELLKHTERAARDLAMPYIALMVTEENEAARNLYESAGFITERRLLCKIL